MKILHINNKTDIDHINNLINSGKDVFILIYMEGCGPCNAVRPEWTKLENILKSKTGNKYNNVVIAKVESDHLDKIKLNSVPEGFPTIKHISNKGHKEEDFNKERTVTALMEWVNSHTSSTNHRGSKRVNKNNQTKKYKRGINRKTRNRGRRTTYGRR
jgi:hypothetical protein